MFLTAERKKRIARVLLVTLVYQLVYPVMAPALTSGPVQPEVQGFEPVGTTDMVDMFTGDFVYNIPLLDVDGYPINISYHGGVTMEQEASWVGLGWSLNPGAVNKAIRGLPDDFAGDSIEKELYIKPEKTDRFGLNAVLEAAGVGQPIINANIDLGAIVTMSNYRGVSVDFTTNAGANIGIGMISAGMNLGASIGSQTGGAFNYGTRIGVSSSGVVSSDLSGSFNYNTNGVYSPRTGLKRDQGFSVSANLSHKFHNKTSDNKDRFIQPSLSVSTGTSVPIGLQNYTAVVSNASKMNSYSGRLKLGGEVFGAYISGSVFGSRTTVTYEENGSRPGVGYLNMNAASDNSILDFSREKDGNFNPTMHFLPQASMTYDVYSVSGQGTGGSFRPFRNDFGSVFDPVTKSTTSEQSGEIEAGIGNLFELGLDYSKTTSESESGPWYDYQREFKGPENGPYEDVYFKEAGELTESNELYLQTIGGTGVVTPDQADGYPNTKPNTTSRREARANHIYPLTSRPMDTAGYLDGPSLLSYTDTAGILSYPTLNKVVIPRAEDASAGKLRRRQHHVTEIVQTQKDGRRYVYGLPVVNNVQREVVFAVDDPGKLNRNSSLVHYTQGVDDKKNNGNGRDHFYSSTVTPTYVTSHLLTGLLSADYTDVTGDGMTDDDLGSFTKFNYTRKSKDYRWRTPIQKDSAQYIPGYLSDPLDDKASYAIGSREQWYLRTIETKNQVAEFYVSPRRDAMGITDRITYGPIYGNEAPYNSSTAEGLSYKLDSIVLYNKHDRFVNGASATPIKTVMFTYDYSLCRHLPNSADRTSSDLLKSGKLTLKSVKVRFGTSNYNMTAPYKFTYGGPNPDYNTGAKNRWDGYKPVEGALSNFEFPFIDQHDNANNAHASAWSLTGIGLPSGGAIGVTYESDDYAYVQDKPAMEMATIKGLGSSSNFQPGNLLYYSASQPNLYLYFKRRNGAENGLLNAKDNYLAGTDLVYYNVQTELAPGKAEAIKGYAKAKSVGYCSDGIHGYVELEAKYLTGSDAVVSPIVYTALNLGRYSLPHILFPGADPDASDVDNIVKGLKSAIKDLFSILENPLEELMERNGAKKAIPAKSFVRLTSPGLRKKGGGQRVAKIEFFDNWAQMTNGAGSNAVYGRVYTYTTDRPDGKGTMSSGVASYEPMTGGDELPQRRPVDYIVQQGSSFPPNDPVDLYQEMPMGESFFPSPVVGYSKVTVHSIHKDIARSARTEDVHQFVTARDFPVQVAHNPIQMISSIDKGLSKVKIEQTAKQGFAITLNDMHGKPRSTEHFALLPITGQPQLISSTKYDYRMSGGRLDNSVPVYTYFPDTGLLKRQYKTMGLETDLTLDNRYRYEETKTEQVTGSLNVFLTPFPIPIGFGYGWPRENKLRFSAATATKVTQQYGITDKVIHNQEGAITELRNEVFDAKTGAPVLTSVNNEFNDREYTINYPGYWGYKQLAAAYTNQNLVTTWGAISVDTLGAYSLPFVNYPGDQHYTLASNQPVAKVQVDEAMPNYHLGDEYLAYLSGKDAPPTRLWMMGYTSDKYHCYIVLAPREPYTLGGAWTLGSSYQNVLYKVVRSGLKNRLQESIQTSVTAVQQDVLPNLSSSYAGLIALNAQTLNHKLTRVPAANETSDVLNPFVTGKVGQFRPEKSVINVKNRRYNTGSTRAAGLFASQAYWAVEKDKSGAYCPDSTVATCDNPIIRMIRFTREGGSNVVRVDYDLFPSNFQHRVFNWQVQNVNQSIPLAQAGSFYINSIPASYFVNQSPNYNRMNWSVHVYNDSLYSVSCRAIGRTDYFAPIFKIYMQQNSPPFYYNWQQFPNPYVFSGNYNSGAALSPYRVRRKIQLGYVGHYPANTTENWVTTQRATLYDGAGNELENEEPGIGRNSAVYGYNSSLPVMVARNAAFGQALFEGFEDYGLLEPVPSQQDAYLRLAYSPFQSLFSQAVAVGTAYRKRTLASSGLEIVGTIAHSGLASLKLTTGLSMPFRWKGTTAPSLGYGSNALTIAPGEAYHLRFWVKSINPSSDPSGYTFPGEVEITGTNTLGAEPITATTGLVDGWQQYEVEFATSLSPTPTYKLNLPGGFYYDDFKMVPLGGNSKGFVYHPVTRKLTATLDENNFATFYEYDNEGNLIRTKKETDRGIITVSESRAGHRVNP